MKTYKVIENKNNGGERMLKIVLISTIVLFVTVAFVLASSLYFSSQILSN